jgi:hypothetical protein
MGRKTPRARISSPAQQQDGRPYDGALASPVALGSEVVDVQDWWSAADKIEQT